MTFLTCVGTLQRKFFGNYRINQIFTRGTAINKFFSCTFFMFGNEFNKTVQQE